MLTDMIIKNLKTEEKAYKKTTVRVKIIDFAY